MLRRAERPQTAAVVTAARLHHETKNVPAAGILLFHLREEKKKSFFIFLTLGLGFRRADGAAAGAAAHSGSRGLDPLCPLWARRRRLMERSLYAQLATERALANADDGEQELVGVRESLNPWLFI